MIGTLIGGLAAARAMRDSNRMLEADERRARRRRDRLLSEDPTQRADARNLLRQLDRRLRQRTAATAAREAMTGASADAAATDKAAANEAMAAATASIAADARSRADRADRDYEQKREELRRERRRLMAGQAESTVKAGSMLDGVTAQLLF